VALRMSQLDAARGMRLAEIVLLYVEVWCDGSILPGHAMAEPGTTFGNCFVMQQAGGGRRLHTDGRDGREGSKLSASDSIRHVPGEGQGRQGSQHRECGSALCWSGVHKVHVACA
jgi:hypothetical protein